MALAIAAGAPMVPPSPMPRKPPATADWLSIWTTSISRNFDGGRHDVVDQARAHELAVLVVNHLFVKRRTNALRDTAVNLSVHDHRIDDAAAIFGDDIFMDLHKAGRWIDLDGGQMRRRTPSSR